MNSGHEKSHTPPIPHALGKSRQSHPTTHPLRYAERVGARLRTHPFFASIARGWHRACPKARWFPREVQVHVPRWKHEGSTRSQENRQRTRAQRIGSGA